MNEASSDRAPLMVIFRNTPMLFNLLVKIALVFFFSFHYKKFYFFFIVIITSSQQKYVSFKNQRGCFKYFTEYIGLGYWTVDLKNFIVVDFYHFGNIPFSQIECLIGNYVC